MFIFILRFFYIYR